MEQVASPLSKLLDSIQKGNNEPEELTIPEQIKQRLYPHQVEGVQWLWKMHHNDYGGALLADDMGLGKTIQICAYLQCIKDLGVLDSCLIIVPKSVIPVWQNSFHEWTDLPVFLFHLIAAKEKDEIRNSFHNQFSIMLTTYDTLKRNVEFFSKFWQNTDSRHWDYIILDEGHKIKNFKSLMSQSINVLRANHRIVLTGTPLQNNLMEIWSIMDWLCDHRLLGERAAFNHIFRRPIELGQDKRAMPDVRAYGNLMAERLREEICKVMLRREKMIVFRDKSIPQISKKTEIVLWCRMNKRQINLYQYFLKSDRVRNVLLTSLQAFACITLLQKISNHLMLLNRNERNQLQEIIVQDPLLAKDSPFDRVLGNDDSDLDSELLDDEPELHEHESDRSVSVISMDDGKRHIERENSAEGESVKHTKRRKRVMSVAKLKGILHSIPEDALYLYGNKLCVIIPLIERLIADNNRTIVFARYLKMLYVIEECLSRKGINTVHYNGTMSTEQRNAALNGFKTRRVDVMLITVGAGGEGITITEADRIIIVDPNWNPTVDDQAIDRAYRIGQTKNVIVYRCVTCGSIEEKMYARQVWKQCVNKKVIENKDTLRHFDKDDLKDLFTMSNPQHSEMRNNIAGLQLQVDLPDNPDHMRFLETLDIDGISEHSQLFLLDTDKISQIVRNTLRHQIKEMDLQALLQTNSTYNNVMPTFRRHQSPVDKDLSFKNLNHGEFYFKSSSDFPQIDSPSLSSYDSYAEALRRSRFDRPHQQPFLPDPSVSPDWMFRSPHLPAFSRVSSAAAGEQKKKRFAPEASSASKRIQINMLAPVIDEIIDVSSSSDSDVVLLDVSGSSDVDVVDSSSSSMSEVKEL